QVAVLFQRTFGVRPDGIIRLPDSGSDRLYFRMTGEAETVIGVYNDNRKENEAFLSMTRTFTSLDLPVPEIIAEDVENSCYLISDLGDQSLFSVLASRRKAETGFPASIMDVYKKVLKTLPLFQIRAGEKMDYRKCYPRHAFDRQSMMWDLNYFKYYFLKLAHIPFDEQALEEDFDTFTTFLLRAEAVYFMYRDFQSRNIMMVGDDPYFIDYQGGRKGALQYDVASLLYDAKADLPQEIRDQLLEFYLDELERYLPGKQTEFLTYYPGFILIRILQALGAYGYRGYYEQKSHFLQSIPYALNNLQNLRNLWSNKKFGIELPTLFYVLNKLIEDPGFTPPPTPPHEGREASSIQDPGSSIQDPATISPGLTVTINSFAYKNGIPPDQTGHGGGFVFDCRALPNPGREARFKEMTGLDQPVMDCLAKEEAVARFLRNVTTLVEQSVTNYLERGFQHLQVSFGCTGGQHRSVYCAEKLKNYLADRYKITINLNHKALSQK
ncbi:MAG: phosphotransferase, partial [Bacteroidales bacterium]|nr:phosphotransferase [Bacteroidales bacterium]